MELEPEIEVVVPEMESSVSVAEPTYHLTPVFKEALPTASRATSGCDCRCFSSQSSISTCCCQTRRIRPHFSSASIQYTVRGFWNLAVFYLLSRGGIPISKKNISLCFLLLFCFFDCGIVVQILRLRTFNFCSF